MLTEKHNDYGWKTKLEGLTGLPGDAVLEKNVAWKKLHTRLQEKPRKKKAVWYWAAACLLAALIIPMMILNKKENMVVKQDPPQKQLLSIPKIAASVPVIVEVPKQVEKKKQANNSIQELHSTGIKTTVIKEEPIAAINETIIKMDPVVTITDTATAIAATIPVKKKLSVVHINELESPSAQFFTTPNYAQKSFKIKFKNGRSASQTIASQQQHEGGFKIKLSPKN